MRALIFVYLLCLQSFFAISQTTGLWQKQQTPVYPGKQDDICFVDANKGWYCNGQGGSSLGALTINGKADVNRHYTGLVVFWLL